MTGTWQGEFSYGPEYGDDLMNEKVCFILKLLDINEQFEGSALTKKALVQALTGHQYVDLLRKALSVLLNSILSAIS